MGINKNQLKVYAAKARTDFTNAVVARAAKFGVFADRIVPAREQGDLLIIDSITYKKADIGVAYAKLIEKVRKVGFEETMNEAAYTWFNRFVALRYMELNNLLPHGYKVIGDDRPEILLNANHLTMPGLNKTKVTDMLLAGTQDEELYEYILLTQLAELNKSLPFLFEKMDAATTLLMPDNLLASDSVRTNLLALEIDNFKEIEVVGWLYQFYISEQKDKLMERGTAYTKEEIPAVTQLFTPNWIVKYMVQNSLGAKWLETYPHSTLKGKMAYYIEPAEQTPEVQAELNALKEDRINPEEIKILDPACGSGHILVEAYDLLKEIYLERGYNRRDIPELIITKNLYGLDIDLRAVQLASFAVAMKALKDNPRLINAEIKPNIMAIDETNALNKLDLVQKLLPPEKVKEQEALMALLDNFENGKTYGSLIQIAPVVCEKLPLLKTLVNEALLSGHIFASSAAEEVLPFVKMAEILSQKYDCVIANPPYMGSKYHNDILKAFAELFFLNSKYNLFAMFIEQGFHLVKKNGFNAMVTMQSWMFLSYFEKMRKVLLQKYTLLTMAHLGARAFREISGEVVQTASFVVRNTSLPSYKGSYLRLIDGDDISKDLNLKLKHNLYSHIQQKDFKKIPGMPIAYWLSTRLLNIFENGNNLIYIYHNQIDATGDAAKTEENTFVAVTDTITKMNDLIVHLINNLSANHILLTSDHGFLFQYSKPDATDRSVDEEDFSGAIISKKRYVIGYDLPKSANSIQYNTKVTAKTEKETEFSLPKGASLYNFIGGSRFVHGGAMPQEFVVPMLQIRQIKDEKKKETTRTKEVEVTLLGNTQRFTNKIQRFQLMQTEPVSNRNKPVTLKIGVYEEEEPVTNIETVTFDSRSDKIEDWKKIITLTLKNRTYSRDKQYSLRLVKENNVVAQDVNIKIDLVYDDEF